MSEAKQDYAYFK